MNTFPEFIKRPSNRIDNSQQNTPDIEGYFYEASDGSQVCLWTYFSDVHFRGVLHEFVMKTAHFVIFPYLAESAPMKKQGLTPLSPNDIMCKFKYGGIENGITEHL